MTEQRTAAPDAPTVVYVESAGKLRRRAAARALLVLLGLPKTVFFNLRYLPLRQAVRLPILVSHRVAFMDIGGTVRIDGPVRPAMILLGFGSNGAFDYRRGRSVWQVAGEVVFDGPARLGHGFKLSVVGRVRFGPEFVLQAESQLVCRQGLTFGRGCLISWDVLILDSDFHPITSIDGDPTIMEAPIVLGDRVWVGARSTILKGVRLGSDVVVAAGSMVTQPEEACGVIVGGNPARVLREGIRWSH